MANANGGEVYQNYAAPQKIIGPNYRWVWYNSGWFVHPKETNQAFYTAYYNKAGDLFARITPNEVKFFTIKKPLPEAYGCGVTEIEKKIWKKRRDNATIFRIDRIRRSLYVAAYITYIGPTLNWPNFNLPKTVSFREDRIIYVGMVPFVSPLTGEYMYKRAIKFLPTRGLIYLNPQFFHHPYGVLRAVKKATQNIVAIYLTPQGGVKYIINN